MRAKVDQWMQKLRFRPRSDQAQSREATAKVRQAICREFLSLVPRWQIGNYRFSLADIIEMAISTNLQRRSKIEAILRPRGIVVGRYPGEQVPYNPAVHRPEEGFTPNRGETVFITRAELTDGKSQIAAAIVGPKFNNARLPGELADSEVNLLKELDRVLQQIQDQR